MAFDPNQLINAFTVSAKRHDDMLTTYTQAARKLFTDIKHTIDSLKVPARFGAQNIFNARIESDSDVYALIIKSNLTKKAHTIGTLVLTFQMAGLDYHPLNGQLCGCIQAIVSDGDYWEKTKSARINPLLGIAVSLANTEMASDMASRRDQKLQAVEGISRNVYETFWLQADSPTVWYQQTNGSFQPITPDDVYAPLDRLYNPEGKDWVYKHN